MSTLPHSLKERVLDAVRAAPTLTRRQWLLRQGALLALALTILVGLTFAHGLTPMRERPALHLWVSVIGFVGLGIASTQALAAFAFAPLGPSRTRLRWLQRAAMPALALIAVLANLAAPETLVGPAPGFHVHLMCPLLLLGSGAIVAALAIRGLRGADPLEPRDTAAALGACAGVWAALAVSLQCHFTDPLHVLATHVLPVSVLAAGAARWGARAVSVTGLALALFTIWPDAASAFVSASVGGQPGQVDVTARADLERGSVEPNENELSWQDAEWEVYSAGVGTRRHARSNTHDALRRIRASLRTGHPIPRGGGGLHAEALRLRYARNSLLQRGTARRVLSHVAAPSASERHDRRSPMLTSPDRTRRELLAREHGRASRVTNAGSRRLGAPEPSCCPQG